MPDWQNAQQARPFTTPSRWLLCVIAGLTVLFAAASEPRASAGDPPQTVANRVPDLDALEQAFEQVVDRVSPSVVGIRAERRHFAAYGAQDDGDGDAELYEQRVVVNGSGTIVSELGLILTNEHVVQAAAEIMVMFHDGERMPATVLASDPRSDLAILQVERQDLPAATFCDWNQVNRGQWSIALGNPFGLGGDGHLSVSVGVVSNLGRQLPGLGEVDDRFYNDMIQTTAEINPGNSGGPLFNVRGELIGVVTAMHTRAPADEGIGFAIPMTLAKRRVVRTLCLGQPVRYGYIGLTVRVPTDEEADRFERLGHTGVVVDRVEPRGPAAMADVRIGDLITRYDGEPVRGPAHMAELVGQTPVGQRASLAVLRNQKLRRMGVTIETRDISRVSWMRGEAILWRGMRLADLNDDARRIMDLEPWVRGIIVVDVIPRSAALQAGMEIGDVISGVGDGRVESTADFLRAVRSAHGPVKLSLRDGDARLVSP